MLQSRLTQLQQAPVRAPISAHPAFPPIVGLWFGALFGLGSMVMPAVVLETLALGMAESPLSASTRAVIALLATVLGIGLGLVLARRVVSLQQGVTAPRRPSTRAPGTPRRPISAHEELGVGPIDAAGEARRPPIAGRRRALTVADEARPSEYLQPAPLPGGEHGWPHVPEPHEPAPQEDAMTDRPSEPFPAQTSADDELDLARFAPPPPSAMAAPAEAPAGAQVFAPLEPAAPEPAAEEIVPPVSAYVPPLDTRKPRAFSVPATPDVFVAAAEQAPAGADGALEGLGMVQLIERLGRSLRQRPAAPQAQPAPEPMAFAAPSFDHQVAAPTVPPPVVPEGLQAFMTEPVEPEPDAAPTPVEPAPAASAPVAASPAIPTAFQPFDHAEDGDDDEHHDPGPFTLPLGSMSPRPFDAPSAPVAASEPEEDEEDALPEAESDYSSLLAMKNPFRPREEFVRVDEPEPEAGEIEPAVVFPGQQPAIGEAAPVVVPQSAARPFDAPHQPAPSTAPARVAASADPAETDRALRSALANLQRMSGAA